MQTLKNLKNAFLMFGGNANAIISNPQAYPIVVSFCPHLNLWSYTDFYEFHRIAQ
jgi:hypothetical protein